MPAGRVLDGARLYVDVVEINPPLVIALNAAAVWAARLLRVSEILVYRLVVTAALLGVAVAFGGVAPRVLLLDVRLRRLLLAGTRLRALPPGRIRLRGAGAPGAGPPRPVSTAGDGSRLARHADSDALSPARWDCWPERLRAQAPLRSWSGRCSRSCSERADRVPPRALLPESLAVAGVCRGLRGSSFRSLTPAVLRPAPAARRPLLAFSLRAVLPPARDRSGCGSRTVRAARFRRARGRRRAIQRSGSSSRWRRLPAWSPAPRSRRVCAITSIPRSASPRVAGAGRGRRVVAVHNRSERSTARWWSACLPRPSRSCASVGRSARAGRAEDPGREFERLVGAGPYPRGGRGRVRHVLSHRSRPIR